MNDLPGSVIPLPPDFSLRDPDTVARELLGKILCRRFDDGTAAAGRICETEAYCQDDPASHSRPGPTERNAPMFGPGGTAYVYLIYGIHHCFNVVTGPAGEGSAVLIRGMIPLTGREAMARRRYPGDDPAVLSASRRRALCDGPGKLCRALDIGRDFNGHRLDGPPLQLFSDGFTVPEEQIRVTPRIGITKGADRLRRYLWEPDRRGAAGFRKKSSEGLTNSGSGNTISVMKQRGYLYSYSFLSAAAVAASRRGIAG